MKFTISTAKMNSILSRISKGVGNSKVLPITEYIKINLSNKILTVVATNSVNFITHIEREVNGADGEVIVKADKLIKLIAKTTKPEVSFAVVDGHLEVKGNGTYKVELFETNEYPSYTFDDNTKEVTVDVATLKKVLATNKSSIATEMLMPCLTGYNVGATAVTTDGVKMCINATSLMNDNALISQSLAELLNNLSGEKVRIQKDGPKLRFSTDNLVIFGTELDGIEEYPDIAFILDIGYDNYCVVAKQQLSDALDRLSLFVDAFTNNGVKLSFTDSGVTVQDLKNSSVEKLDFVEKSHTEDTEVTVNIHYLSDLLDAVAGERVMIYYGEGLPVKIVEGNVTQFVSQMEAEGSEAAEETTVEE